MLAVICRPCGFFTVSDPEELQLCEAYSELPASSEKPCEQVMTRPMCHRRCNEPRAGHRQPLDLRESGSSAFYQMQQGTALSCTDEKWAGPCVQARSSFEDRLDWEEVSERDHGCRRHTAGESCQWAG